MGEDRTANEEKDNVARLPDSTERSGEDESDDERPNKRKLDAAVGEKTTGLDDNGEDHGSNTSTKEASGNGNGQDKVIENELIFHKQFQKKAEGGAWGKAGKVTYRVLLERNKEEDGKNFSWALHPKKMSDMVWNTLSNPIKKTNAEIAKERSAAATADSQATQRRLRLEARQAEQFHDPVISAEDAPWFAQNMGRFMATTKLHMDAIGRKLASKPAMSVKDKNLAQIRQTGMRFLRGYDRKIDDSGNTDYYLPNYGLPYRNPREDHDMGFPSSINDELVLLAKNQHDRAWKEKTERILTKDFLDETTLDGDEKARYEKELERVGPLVVLTTVTALAEMQRMKEHRRIRKIWGEDERKDKKGVEKIEVDHCSFESERGNAKRNDKESENPTIIKGSVGKPISNILCALSKGKFWAQHYQSSKTMPNQSYYWEAYNAMSTVPPYTIKKGIHPYPKKRHPKTGRFVSHTELDQDAEPLNGYEFFFNKDSKERTLAKLQDAAEENGWTEGHTKNLEGAVKTQMWQKDQYDVLKGLDPNNNQPKYAYFFSPKAVLGGEDIPDCNLPPPKDHPAFLPWPEWLKDSETVASGGEGSADAANGGEGGDGMGERQP
jgi:hypothetical protein